MKNNSDWIDIKRSNEFFINSLNDKLPQAKKIHDLKKGRSNMSQLYLESL